MKFLTTLSLMFCISYASAQFGDAYHKPYEVDVWRQQAQKSRNELNNSYQGNLVKSTSRSTVSGDYNSYGWSEANSMRRKRQLEAEARQDAAYYNLHCKSGNCTSGSGVWMLTRGDLFHGYFTNGSPDLSRSAKIVYAEGATVDGYFRISARGDYVPVKKTSATFSNGSSGYAEEGEDGWVKFTNSAGNTVSGNGEEVAGYTGSSSKYCQGNCIETLVPQNKSYVYTGNTLNGIPHGKGEIKFANGASYAGDFKEGLPDGYGITKWPNGVVHEGQIRKGLIQGEGTMDYADGQIFEGQFSNGNPVKGVLRFGRGNVYEGALNNWSFEGEATLRFGTGQVFKGEFRNDKAYYGTITYKDGGTFTGYMHRGITKIIPYAGVHEDPAYTYYGYFDTLGKRSGYGYYAYPEGDVQKGKWKNGDLYEFGAYVFKNKQNMICGKVNYKGAQIWGLYNHEGKWYPAKMVNGKIEYLTNDEAKEATDAFTATQEYLTKEVAMFNEKLAGK